MSDSSLDTLQLETPRLILRVPRLSDLDSFAALMADEEAARVDIWGQTREEWRARQRA
jgi:RimJ/RimL family protein N-acetyltransferase